MKKILLICCCTAIILTLCCCKGIEIYAEAYTDIPPDLTIPTTNTTTLLTSGTTTQSQEKISLPTRTGTATSSIAISDSPQTNNETTTTTASATTSSKVTTTTTVAHTWATKKIAATCLKEGKQYQICTTCGKTKNTKTIAKLEHQTENVVTIKRTCVKDGEIQTICKVCKTVLQKRRNPAHGHGYAPKIAEQPTPVKDGTMLYSCCYCTSTYTEPIKFEPKGKNNLCIPSVKMNVEVILAECNQESTDRNDVSCDTNFINELNPLFFGHNTRTLGKLYNVKVGDIIYFTIGGKVSQYKVTISEPAYVIDGGQNIKGAETGTTVLEKCEKETLHFFTCYWHPMNIGNNRWIILAEKIK